MTVLASALFSQFLNREVGEAGEREKQKVFVEPPDWGLSTTGFLSHNGGVFCRDKACLVFTVVWQS